MATDNLLRISRALLLLSGTAVAFPLYPFLSAVPVINEHDRITRERYAALPTHAPLCSRIAQLAEEFHASIESDGPEVLAKSAAYGIIPEAVLSAIFVEYARMHTFTFQDSLRSREGMRTGIKYGLLDLPGGAHVVETLLGKSVGYGSVHRKTLEQVLTHPLGMEIHEGNSTHRNSPAAIGSISRILALHQRVWEHAGYPLYHHPFPAVHSPADRVGLHITLYNIFDFAKRASVPHGDPKIGGSVIPALQMRYGDLAAIYAEQYVRSFIPPHTPTH